MLRKLLVLTLLLGGGLGYLWHESPFPAGRTKLASLWGSGRDFQGLDPHGLFDRPGTAVGNPSEPQVRPQLTGAQTEQLSDALRFDVAPEWVTSRWARVSTVLSEQQFKGLRVPLVTGTKLDDLAGSLTYYFDHQQRVRRVTFTGNTGDPDRLVKLVTERFRFKVVPSQGAGMFLAHWNGRPTSALRITHAPVIRSADPLSQFTVDLEINLPEMGYRLSPRFEQLVANDRAMRRW